MTRGLIEGGARRGTRCGRAGLGLVRRGTERGLRHGQARPGGARLGTRFGMAGRGKAWSDEVWRGTWLGRARRGWAR